MRGTGAALLIATIALTFGCDRVSPSAGGSTERSLATATKAGPAGPPAPSAPAPATGDEPAPALEGVSVAKQAAAPERQSMSGPFSSTVPTTLATFTQAAPAGSMIVRTGYAQVEVDSLDMAIARVRALAQRVGGFVANTSAQGGRDQLRTASLELKVPSERFDDALGGLAPIGKVESVNVNAEDVGEEYVDIAARVENAHRLEARLIALLANRTGKLQEVLSVERELARVREEIERYEGRLRFLRSRVSLSTLTIAVHERAPIIAPVAGDGPITVAFRAAWRNFVGVLAACIASLGILIPLGVLAAVAWLAIRRWLPHRAASPTPAEP